MNHCQYETEEGVSECGFLIGIYCMANPGRKFQVTKDFHDRLKIVGCESFNRYMDYGERRERFGKDSVENGSERSEGNCQGRRIDTVQEMSKPEMAGDRHSERSERGQTVPMRVLQQGCDSTEHPKDDGSVGSDMTEKPKCSVCGEDAVANDGGLFYCLTHHKLWSQCVTHEKMLKDHEKEFGDLKKDTGVRK
jgi:hypothetical protein